MKSVMTDTAPSDEWISNRNTFLQHCYDVPCCTFRAIFKVSGAKTRVQHVTLEHFCYDDIGTYCCVCITLLQISIAVVHNSNIRGVLLKVNALTQP